MSKKIKDLVIYGAVALVAVAGAAFVYKNGGTKAHKAHKAHKATKVHYRTYAQAGNDLQTEFAPILQRKGYEFNVVACYRDKGVKYICSAFLSQGRTKVCSILRFTDTTGKDIKVSNAGQAKDPSLCK